MDLNKLEKLNELKEKGVLTQEEFEQAKQKALGQTSFTDAALDMDNKTYSMLMHLSQLCSFVVPMSGLIVPVVMWLVKKEDSFIDDNGKVIVNWILSSLIYFIACLLLMIVVVGAFLLPVLLILVVVFSIVGAIRANSGIVKNYPLSIPFFTVNTRESDQA